MEDSERRTVCVICGRRIEAELPLRLVVGSEKHPGRTFFVHPVCLKDVAKPGFVGLKDL